MGNNSSGLPREREKRRGHKLEVSKEFLPPADDVVVRGKCVPWDLFKKRVTKYLLEQGVVNSPEEIKLTFE